MGGLFGQQGKSTSSIDKMAAGIRFQTSAYGLAWTLLFGRNRITGNLVDYQDFTAIPHTETQTQGQGGKGGGGVTSSHTSFTYRVALALGLIAGPVAADAIKTVWVGKEKKYGTNAAIGSSYPRTSISYATLSGGPSPSPPIFELMTGAMPQEPWSYMVTYHPERAVGYHGLACAVASAFDLGDNENLDNIGLEMVGLLPYDQPASVTDYEVTLPSDTEVTEPFVIPASPYQVTVAHGAHWTRSISVISDDSVPVTFTEVSGAPGPGEYSVTNEGVYTFNAADVGTSGDIAYAYQDDPMEITVPEYLHFVEDSGVKDAADNPMVESGSSIPAVDQYSEDGAGGYTFSRFNSGELKKISYVYNEQLGAVPDEILIYIWTNFFNGLGQSADKLEDLTDYRNFVLANNWLLSPFLTAQEPAKDFWERILEMTNSWPVWRSPGKIGIIPRGDAQIIGNDVIWTPDRTSLFSFNTDHFLVDGASTPLRWVGATPRDRYNKVTVEFLNRENEYNTEPADYTDEADVVDHGLKTDDQVYKCHEITDATFAQQVCQNKVNDYLFQPDEYEADLPWQFAIYEPGDIVDLSDVGLSLDSQLVMIVRKVISQDGCPRFTYRILDDGSGSPGSHDVAQGEGYAPDTGVDPGSVNTPVIFVPPSALMEQEMEVWAAISGGANFGGCNVWISESGENYKYVGQFIGNSRHGILSSDLPSSSSSPDTVNTLSVDLTTSRGALNSGTQTDAENYNTLCRINSGASVEYLAYKTATLTAQYKYDLTWLVRGAYGSGMLLRPSGSTFVRLDGAVFKYACKRTDIGKTIYIKFQAFNAYQRAVQDLADIDAYTFTITSPGDEGTNPVVGLTASNNSVSPQTKLDIAFTNCPAYNDAASEYDIQALGFTIDAGTTGVNGLDTGALGASKLYYYYAIANASTGAAGGLLSLSASAPTMPSGYTHKRLLGVAYTDGSSHFLEFSQVGHEWLYGDVQALATGSTAQSWADQDASGLIPPISTRGKFLLMVEDDESASVAFGLRKNGSAATLGQVYGTCLPGATAQVNDWCDTDSSQLVELNVDLAVNWELYVSGFYLTI